MKRWVIGIDEAGYGPKLGPLVVGASVWRIPSELHVDSLAKLLHPEFQGRPRKGSDESFLPLGDSKVIFQDRSDLEAMGLTIRFLCNLAKLDCNSTSNLMEGVSRNDANRVEQVPWYDASLDPETWAALAFTDEVFGRGHEKMQRLGIEFHGFQSRIIDESEFNRMVSRSGNKANALGEWSLGLLRDTIDSLCRSRQVDGDLQVEACCDRQGGRKRYLPLLDHVFQAWSPWFDVLDESSDCSRYRGRFHDLDLQARFQVKGDSMFPTGAASMLAKWVRELLMRRLNRYWQSQIGEGLQATAGYPVDTERFRKAIESRSRELMHAEDSWWRCC